ncbi:peroxide stress protein YaaA [Aestuariimicrobium sp. Y1814]|uniref:peroxide stress protein YaaA n=1 Tax=Aestuariimicrobium sp. Y1814 TaxID=3418742 RepID=UPI003DA6F99C
MLALLSPAKSLDATSPLTTRKHSQPRQLDDSQRLIEVMRTKSVPEVAALMDISDELAALNVDRYASFETPFTTSNARPAALLFNGDAYQGLDARQRFDERDWTEAQKTLRILSGLYGLLRPLDLIQPYRLEMGIGLHTDAGRNLYDYWGSRITDLVRDDLAASPGPEVIVNLASTEYSTAVDFDAIDARVISPRFENRDRSGNWKVISFPAKRARGTMVGWLVTERVRSARAITEFAEDGYRYAKDVSTPDVPVFRRD